MPRYDFKCPRCGHVFEKYSPLETIEFPTGEKEQRIKHDKWPCHKCNDLAIRQLPKQFNFQFNTLDWNYHKRDSYLDG